MGSLVHYHGSIVLLTGKSDIGKTRYCQELVKVAKKSDRNCAGILSLKLVDEGETIGYEAMDIRTGEKRILADRSSKSKIVLGDWFFNPQTLAWGNGILAATQSCDLFVIDELGPLELERDEGWMQAFPVLEKGEFFFAMVVVRPSLLDKICQRFSGRIAAVIDFSDANTLNPDQFFKSLSFQ